MPASSPALGRIGQIALTVHDMDRSIAFWRDAVGLKFLFQAPNVAFFDVEGVRLMLGSAESPEVKPAGTVLYFEVADLDGTFAALRERGVVVAKGGEPHFIAKLGATDLWMAFLEDPDGHLFALMAQRAAS
ncbi:MAG TPA: VOC family protein [Rhodanobacteraceae bacterium]|jgi:methylmalonyl-CoA/ethylmalonyl-CoA epimerase|nr:VOC family protein [Rhodanobacteraceae bacterium]